MAEQRGGWGSVDGVRLSVLILADPERAHAAAGVARALERAHRVTLLAERRGAIASHLIAARAARSVSPRLVHAIGARGFAATAAPISRGTGAKLVVSLSANDLIELPLKSLVRVAHEADALLLDSDAQVDPLRRAGMNRSVYVLPSPLTFEDDAPYLSAIEIVYGRLVAGETESESKVPPDPEERIVQIGGLRKSSDSER